MAAPSAWAALEFGPHTIAGQLDQASAVARYGGLEAFDAVLHKPRRPVVFLLPRGAAITDHVCVKIRRPNH